MAAPVGKVVWIGRGLSVLSSLAFLLSSVMKMKGGPEVLQGFGHLGLRESMMLPLAILELSCVVVYLVPPTAVLGAVLLTGYIGGAILAHWRVGDPFLPQIVLGLMVWLGLYLREGRLRGILPLRTSLK